MNIIILIFIKHRTISKANRPITNIEIKVDKIRIKMICNVKFDVIFPFYDLPLKIYVYPSTKKCRKSKI